MNKILHIKLSVSSPSRFDLEGLTDERSAPGKQLINGLDCVRVVRISIIFGVRHVATVWKETDNLER